MPRPLTAARATTRAPEHHIASFALRCDPQHLGTLRPVLAALPGASIEAEDAATGKVVMVMEAPDERVITSTLSRIQVLPGVAHAALVYQHILTPEHQAPTEGSQP